MVELLNNDVIDSIVAQAHVTDGHTDLLGPPQKRNNSTLRI